MPAQLRTRFIVMLVVGLIPSGTLSAAAQSDQKKPIAIRPVGNVARAAGHWFSQPASWARWSTDEP